MRIQIAKTRSPEKGGGGGGGGGGNIKENQKIKENQMTLASFLKRFNALLKKAFQTILQAGALEDIWNQHLHRKWWTPKLNRDRIELRTGKTVVSNTEGDPNRAHLAYLKFSIGNRMKNMSTTITGGNCYKYHFCRNKTRFLSRQKYACRDKIM